MLERFEDPTSPKHHSRSGQIGSSPKANLVSSEFDAVSDHSGTTFILDVRTARAPVEIVVL